MPSPAVNPVPQTPLKQPKLLMSKRLLVTGIILLLLFVPSLFLLIPYFFREHVEIDIPFLGRIDFSQTLMKEGEVGFSFYGPVEKDDIQFLIGKLFAKSVNTDHKITSLTIITDKNYSQKTEFPVSDNALFYYQLPRNEFDEKTGAIRYKKYKGINDYLITEEDWLSVRYTQNNQPLIITRLQD